MKINSINSIYFRSNGQAAAPRSQQQSNLINFEKEKNLAQKADSLNANPITSLGYKLYRTFRFLSEHEGPTFEDLNLIV